MSAFGSKADIIVGASAHKQPSLEAELASIRGTVDSQPIAAGLSVKVLLGEPVESLLDREAAVGVVHVVIDDKVMQLLRLPPAAASMAAAGLCTTRAQAAVCCRSRKDRRCSSA